MATTLVNLRQFTAQELIFSPQETKQILSFLFKQESSLLVELQIDNTVRAFAQGLLIEAIDASQYQELQPSKARHLSYHQPEINRLIKQLIKDAPLQWFTQVRNKYQCCTHIDKRVREQLALHFTRRLELHVHDVDKINLPIQGVLMNYRQHQYNFQVKEVSCLN